MSIREKLKSYFELNGFELALRLTLLDLLLRPIGYWETRPFVLTLAVIAFLLPNQVKNPVIWFALTFLAALRLLLAWPLSDNHAYLLCYWCLAISLSLISKDGENCLKLNGRFLIGLAFAFAILWKLALSPDYVDGRFFKITMLTDHRFESFTQLMGALNQEQMEELRHLISQHVDGQILQAQKIPDQPERFVLVSQILTHSTLIMESLVALSFLWPLGRGISKFRDIFLIIFCVTTYAVATVQGFGWLLIAMGVAQSDPGKWRIRIAYIAVYVLIIFYKEVPWIDLLLGYFTN
jgi:hypothetical protein